MIKAPRAALCAAACFLLMQTIGNISTAHAAEWYVLYTVGTDSHSWFFDFNTVKTGAGTVTLWVATEARTEDESTKTMQASSSRVRYLVDCKGNTMKQLALTKYDSKGQPTRSQEQPLPSEDIIPGTTGEALREVVCQPSFPKPGGTKEYEKALGEPRELADLIYTIKKNLKSQSGNDQKVP